MIEPGVPAHLAVGNDAIRSNGAESKENVNAEQMSVAGTLSKASQHIQALGSSSSLSNADFDTLATVLIERLRQRSRQQVASSPFRSRWSSADERLTGPIPDEEEKRGEGWSRAERHCRDRTTRGGSANSALNQRVHKRRMLGIRSSIKDGSEGTEDTQSSNDVMIVAQAMLRLDAEPTEPSQPTTPFLSIGNLLADKKVGEQCDKLLSKRIIKRLCQVHMLKRLAGLGIDSGQLSRLTEGCFSFQCGKYGRLSADGAKRGSNASRTSKNEVKEGKGSDPLRSIINTSCSLSVDTKENTIKAEGRCSLPKRTGQSLNANENEQLERQKTTRLGASGDFAVTSPISQPLKERLDSSNVQLSVEVDGEAVPADVPTNGHAVNEFNKGFETLLVPLFDGGTSPADGGGTGLDLNCGIKRPSFDVGCDQQTPDENDGFYPFIFDAADFAAQRDWIEKSGLLDSDLLEQFIAISKRLEEMDRKEKEAFIALTRGSQSTTDRLMPAIVEGCTDQEQKPLGNDDEACLTGDSSATLKGNSVDTDGNGRRRKCNGRKRSRSTTVEDDATPAFKGFLDLAKTEAKLVSLENTFGEIMNRDGFSAMLKQTNESKPVFVDCSENADRGQDASILGSCPILGGRDCPDGLEVDILLPCGSENIIANNSPETITLEPLLSFTPSPPIDSSGGQSNPCNDTRVVRPHAVIPLSLSRKVPDKVRKQRAGNSVNTDQVQELLKKRKVYDSKFRNIQNQLDMLRKQVKCAEVAKAKGETAEMSGFPNVPQECCRQLREIITDPDFVKMLTLANALCETDQGISSPSRVPACNPDPLNIRGQGSITTNVGNSNNRTSSEIATSDGGNKSPSRSDGGSNPSRPSSPHQGSNTGMSPSGSGSGNHGGGSGGDGSDGGQDKRQASGVSADGGTAEESNDEEDKSKVPGSLKRNSHNFKQMKKDLIIDPDSESDRESKRGLNGGEVSSGATHPISYPTVSARQHRISLGPLPNKKPLLTNPSNGASKSEKPHDTGFASEDNSQRLNDNVLLKSAFVSSLDPFRNESNADLLDALQKSLSGFIDASGPGNCDMSGLDKLEATFLQIAQSVGGFKNHDPRAAAFLLKVIETGQFDFLKTFLNESPELDMDMIDNPYLQEPKSETTPLMEAANRGRYEFARALIVGGADVNAKTVAKNTALHFAALGGHSKIIDILIRCGANVEEINDHEHTPLMEAAAAGQVQAAATLLNHGALINAHSNEFKESALTLACYKGNLAMVEFLIESGADMHHKTEEMHTPLMEACMDGHVEVAKLLIKHGVEVNMPENSFESPLTLAACGGHKELVKLLLDHGAKIEERNDEGYTPLMESSREGYEDVAKLLIEIGANVNATTEETQETALSLASCGGYLEVVKELVAHGADVNMGPTTPLMEAAQEGHCHVVQFLLQHEAIHDKTSALGDTAFSLACDSGREDVVLILADHYQNIDLPDKEKGFTPLMKASRGGHLGIVKFLVCKGANVNRLSKSKEHTPLSLACSFGRIEVVRFLIRSGSDVKQRLHDGSNCLIEAARGGHSPVVTMLFMYMKGQPVDTIKADDGTTLAKCLSAFQNRDLLMRTGLYQTEGLPTGLSYSDGSVESSNSGERADDKNKDSQQKRDKSAHQRLAQELLNGITAAGNSLKALRAWSSSDKAPTANGIVPTNVDKNARASNPKESATTTDSTSKSKPGNEMKCTRCTQVVTLNGKQVEKGSKAKAPVAKVDNKRSRTGTMSRRDKARPDNESLIPVDCSIGATGDTALSLACLGGFDDTVLLLLTEGANVEHRDKKGLSPLMVACSAGHLGTVQLLVAHGAQIEAYVDKTRDTCLCLSASTGQTDIVSYLLSIGANKEHRNSSDYTPLCLAASGGFVDAIKILATAGADINSRTNTKLGITPLMLASMNGHLGAVNKLLAFGADINAQIETNKNTALTLACYQGRCEVVKMLIEYKANIEHRAKTGLTPLMEAASGGYAEVGAALIEMGADVNAPPVPSSRDTPLTIAADKGHDNNAAIDAKNKKSCTALWLAASAGHLSVVQTLVSNGATVDVEDSRRVSVLMAAFKKGHTKVVKFLVRHVRQFPNEADCTKFISTCQEKDLHKRCKTCMDIMMTAREHQMKEANRAADSLIAEITMEESREQSRKQQAAKRRAKKKMKKQEKTTEKETHTSMTSGSTTDVGSSPAHEDFPTDEAASTTATEKAMPEQGNDKGTADQGVSSAKVVESKKQRNLRRVTSNKAQIEANEVAEELTDCKVKAESGEVVVSSSRQEEIKTADSCVVEGLAVKGAVACSRLAQPAAIKGSKKKKPAKKKGTAASAVVTPVTNVAAPSDQTTPVTCSKACSKKTSAQIQKKTSNTEQQQTEKQSKRDPSLRSESSPPKKTGSKKDEDTKMDAECLVKPDVGSSNEEWTEVTGRQKKLTHSRKTSVHAMTVASTLNETPSLVISTQTSDRTSSISIPGSSVGTTTTVSPSGADWRDSSNRGGFSGRAFRQRGTGRPYYGGSQRKGDTYVGTNTFERGDPQAGGQIGTSGSSYRRSEFAKSPRQYGPTRQAVGSAGTFRTTRATRGAHHGRGSINRPSPPHTQQPNQGFEVYNSLVYYNRRVAQDPAPNSFDYTNWSESEGHIKSSRYLPNAPEEREFSNFATTDVDGPRGYDDSSVFVHQGPSRPYVRAVSQERYPKCTTCNQEGPRNGTIQYSVPPQTRQEAPSMLDFTDFPKLSSSPPPSGSTSGQASSMARQANRQRNQPTAATKSPNKTAHGRKFVAPKTEPTNAQLESCVGQTSQPRLVEPSNIERQHRDRRDVGRVPSGTGGVSSSVCPCLLAESRMQPDAQFQLRMANIVNTLSNAVSGSFHPNQYANELSARNTVRSQMQREDLATRRSGAPCRRSEGVPFEIPMPKRNDAGDDDDDDDESSYEDSLSDAGSMVCGRRPRRSTVRKLQRRREQQAAETNEEVPPAGTSQSVTEVVSHEKSNDQPAVVSHEVDQSSFAQLIPQALINTSCQSLTSEILSQVASLTLPSAMNQVYDTSAVHFCTAASLIPIPFSVSSQGDFLTSVSAVFPSGVPSQMTPLQEEVFNRFIEVMKTREQRNQDASHLAGLFGTSPFQLYQQSHEGTGQCVTMKEISLPTSYSSLFSITSTIASSICSTYTVAANAVHQQSGVPVSSMPPDSANWANLIRSELSQLRSPADQPRTIDPSQQETSSSSDACSVLSALQRDVVPFPTVNPCWPPGMFLEPQSALFFHPLLQKQHAAMYPALAEPPELYEDPPESLSLTLSSLDGCSTSVPLDGSNAISEALSVIAASIANTVAGSSATTSALSNLQHLQMIDALLRPPNCAAAGGDILSDPRIPSMADLQLADEELIGVMRYSEGQRHQFAKRAIQDTIRPTLAPRQPQQPQVTCFQPTQPMHQIVLQPPAPQQYMQQYGPSQQQAMGQTSCFPATSVAPYFFMHPNQQVFNAQSQAQAFNTQPGLFSQQSQQHSFAAQPFNQQTQQMAFNQPQTFNHGAVNVPAMFNNGNSTGYDGNQAATAFALAAAGMANNSQANASLLQQQVMQSSLGPVHQFSLPLAQANSSLMGVNNPNLAQFAAAFANPININQARQLMQSLTIPTALDESSLPLMAALNSRNIQPNPFLGGMPPSTPGQNELALAANAAALNLPTALGGIATNQPFQQPMHFQPQSQPVDPQQAIYAAAALQQFQQRQGMYTYPASAAMDRTTRMSNLQQGVSSTEQRQAADGVIIPSYGTTDERRQFPSLPVNAIIAPDTILSSDPYATLQHRVDFANRQLAQSQQNQQLISSLQDRSNIVVLPGGHPWIADNHVSANRVFVPSTDAFTSSQDVAVSGCRAGLPHNRSDSENEHFHGDSADNNARMAPGGGTCIKDNIVANERRRYLQPQARAQFAPSNSSAGAQAEGFVGQGGIRVQRPSQPFR